MMKFRRTCTTAQMQSLTRDVGQWEFGGDGKIQRRQVLHLLPAF